MNTRSTAEENNKAFKFAEAKIELQTWMIKKFQQILADRENFFKERYGLKQINTSSLAKQVELLKQEMGCLKESTKTDFSIINANLSNLKESYLENRRDIDDIKSYYKTMLSDMRSQMNRSSQQIIQASNQTKRQRNEVQKLIEEIKTDEQKFKKQMIDGGLDFLRKVQEVKELSLGISEEFESKKETYNGLSKNMNNVNQDMLKMRDMILDMSSKVESINKTYKNSQFSKLLSYTNSKLLHIENYIEKYEPFYSYITLSTIMRKVLDEDQVERLRYEDKRLIQNFNKMCLEDDGRPNLGLKIEKLQKVFEQFQKDTITLRRKREKKAVKDKEIIEEKTVIKQVSEQSIWEKDILNMQQRITKQEIQIEAKITQIRSQLAKQMEDIKYFVQKKISDMQLQKQQFPETSLPKSVFKIEEVFNKNSTELDLNIRHHIMRRKVGRAKLQEQRSVSGTQTPGSDTWVFSSRQRRSCSRAEIHSQPRYL